MKIKKSYYLAMFFVFLSNFSANAHELNTKFMQGKWTIKGPSVPARVLFHAGHNHAPSSNPPLMVFNLCVDKFGSLYGKASNNLLNDYESKLRAESWLSLDHEFFLTLVPLNRAISSKRLLIEFLHDDSMNKRTIKVSFDGGLNYYTATRENGRATPACIKYMRSQKRQSR
jgi:hypothetical protein